MPNKDRSGPDGQGPKTGRGSGKCGPNSSDSFPQGQKNQGSGKGKGGRGQGQGANKQGKGKGAGKGRGNGR